MSRIAYTAPVVVEPDARKRLSANERLVVLQRQAGLCAHCGEPFPTSLHPSGLNSIICEFDHVVPLELGGSNSLDNIECLDPKCHKLKTKSDVRAIAKARRLRAKNDPNAPPRKAKRAIPSRPFQKKAKHV